MTDRERMIDEAVREGVWVSYPKAFYSVAIRLGAERLRAEFPYMIASIRRQFREIVERNAAP